MARVYKRFIGSIVLLICNVVCLFFSLLYLFNAIFMTQNVVEIIVGSLCSALCAVVSTPIVLDFSGFCYENIIEYENEINNKGE